MNPDIDIDHFIAECREAEQAIAARYGEFSLFALLEREDLPGNWDIVMAASWYGSRGEAIDALVETLQPRLSKDEWLSVARVVPLSPSDPFVRTVNRLVAAQHEAKEMGLGVLNGVFVSHAVVITSNPVPGTASKQPAHAA